MSDRFYFVNYEIVLHISERTVLNLSVVLNALNSNERGNLYSEQVPDRSCSTSSRATYNWSIIVVDSRYTSACARPQCSSQLEAITSVYPLRL